MNSRNLYKYRCVSDLSLRMLNENKYYFAPAYSFNDPLDCAIEPVYEIPSIEKIIAHQAKILQDNDGISYKEALQESQRIKNIPSSELKELLHRLRGNIRCMLNNEYGILSLSAINENILMWSHYADYHKGFCIEFKRLSTNPLGAAQPVQYVKDYPSFNYFDDLPGNIVKRILLTKAIDWCYEEEWRGIQKANTEVRYTDDMISGIIFGLRMPEDHKKEIYKILKNKKHIQYYQAELSPRKFKLKINKL
ncbi:MAG: DUF2971 domain-containing protein [Candidatus Lokiarchaeota archaeon]|nr:DUF2971 domain-containing protein [Candidatus Lokiarchaeota archaeon]